MFLLILLRSDPSLMYVSGLWLSQISGFLPFSFGFVSGAVLEAEAVISSLEDMAMMRETIEERGHSLKLRLVVMMTLVRS